ncbi:hypothetical protein [Sedimenticola selenatireducens]|uniref:Uncharacterized protein n=1 Tax=Sedimenticola selenatireducens TaxID=191960 RepID=A0A557SCI9_9GAMM|nr:hypothetical protein [Sedimenticola selenatireducens]TVO75135.1 hypothetical protein FHP88_08975 [Sedimenticola selenatireducens]TVT67010.1 MAG: hypothetical protein FHK78_01380 [Sedimenticola selenatireducens]
MGFKSIDRARKIADELQEINRTVARSISDMSRDLTRVQHFAAFVFNSAVNGDGDADSADVAAVVAEFRAQRAQIDAFIPMLDAIQAINDEAVPTNIPTNLAAFIANENIDLNSYVTRFK